MGFDKYYLNLKSQTNNTHLIHETGCPFMPGHEHRIFLGTFNSEDDAIIISRKFVNRPGKCRFCSDENYTDRSSFNDPEKILVHKMISSDDEGKPWESAFLSCVN
jgi:hypothetical protein